MGRKQKTTWGNDKLIIDQMCNTKVKALKVRFQRIIAGGFSLIKKLSFNPGNLFLFIKKLQRVQFQLGDALVNQVV